MNQLVKVSKNAWVSIDEIEAIVWSGFSECPRIMLRSGQYVDALDYRAERDGEAQLDKLVRHITKLSEFPV